MENNRTQKKGSDKRKLMFVMLSYILCPMAVLVLFQNCGSKMTTSQVNFASLGDGDLIVPEPTEKPPVEVLEYKSNAFVNQMVANRVLTTNYFKSIFGDDFLATASSYIGRQASDFGSSFTIYDRVVTTDCATKRNPLTLCLRGDTLDLDAQPTIGVNVRREAWRIRACHVATKLKTLNALKKIDAKTTSAKIPEINDENLEKAFHLFFRARKSPSIELLDSLTIASQRADKPIDQWKNVLLALCLSPHWQVL
jgi:hypothetical protein